MRRSTSIFALCFITLSCASAEETPANCVASDWTPLIGLPAEAADKVPDPKRLIPPNSAVTQDDRPERTNIDLDADGVITRIWCG